jgi:hypothetical protein
MLLSILIILCNGSWAIVSGGKVLALILQNLFLWRSVLPSLARVELHGLIDELGLLRIEECQVVLAKPVKVVYIHWTLLR